jgi:phage FluMu protein gp41
VPATNWHTWTPEYRRFVDLVGTINGALSRGQSLAAQARRHADLLDLVEQLEDAEARLLQRPEERA